MGNALRWLLGDRVLAFPQPGLYSVQQVHAIAVGCAARALGLTSQSFELVSRFLGQRDASNRQSKCRSVSCSTSRSCQQQTSGKRTNYTLGWHT